MTTLSNNPLIRMRQTSSRTLNPGEDLEVTGMNDFIRSANDFQSSNDAFVGTANQAGLSGAIADSRNVAQESFDTTEGVLGRRQKALGIQLTDRQKRGQKRQLSLSRAIAQDEATNATREGFQNRAVAASKQAVGLEQSLRDLESAGRIQLSSNAAQEQVRIEQERAKKKASRAGLLGSLVGAGLSIATGGLSAPLTAAIT